MTEKNPLLTLETADTTPSQTLSTGEPEVLLDIGDCFRRRDKRQEKDKPRNAHATMSVDPLSIETI